MRIFNYHVIYGAVILVLAIKNETKRTFLFCGVLNWYQNSTDDQFVDLGFGVLNSEKKIENYSRIHSYFEMDIPTAYANMCKCLC